MLLFITYIRPITREFYTHHTVVTCAKFVVIGWSHFKPEHSKFRSNFEFVRNTVGGTGTKTTELSNPMKLEHLLVLRNSLQTNVNSTIKTTTTCFLRKKRMHTMLFVLSFTARITVYISIGSNSQMRLTSGPRFNIKMTSCQYWKSNCGDKTVVTSSYLHNKASNTGKNTYLHWIGLQVLQWIFLFTLSCNTNRVTIYGLFHAVHMHAMVCSH